MNILQKVRVMRGLTRRIAAEEAGISERTLLTIEYNQEPIINDSVRKILDYYGISTQKYAENFYSAIRDANKFLDSMLK